MRKHLFETGEFYHIYNRGVEKRTIFLDEDDFKRFIKSMNEFNATRPVGSLYENSFIKNRIPRSPLANIICYCLNANHYHFILEQRANGGISEFIKRLSGGYTGYFNIKYRRNGVLFQGKFKSAHINSNEYLLHASAYINLNDRVHGVKSKNTHSSWKEYIESGERGLCKKGIILNQFENNKEYKEFCETSMPAIIERKKSLKELEQLLLD